MKKSARICPACYGLVMTAYPKLSVDHETPQDQNNKVLNADKDTQTVLEREDKTTQTEYNSTDRISMKQSMYHWTAKQILVFDLAKSERVSIQKHAKQLEDKFNDINYMETMDLATYLTMQNPTISAFLFGISGCDINSDLSQAVMYMLSKAAETLMHLATTTILLLHFRESVVIYSIANNKVGTSAIAKSSPYASYSCIPAWLEKLSTVYTNQYCDPGPCSDIIVAFNNNQVLRKTWQVRVDNSFKASTVTMNVAFELQGTKQMEHIEKLKPGNWMNQTLSEIQLQHLMDIDRQQIHKETHYTFLRNLKQCD